MDKYHWANRASEYHKTRMLSLAGACDLIGDVRGEKDEKYMMYLVDSIDYPDGGRRYEFLIEYDIYNPSQGIYFGCKSLTLPPHRHSGQIRKAEDDWRKAMPYVLQRLNNTFIDKDFTYRFRETDNDHNGTFWPFWISLYEDEDPREVGVRALEIISGVYRELVEGTLPPASVIPSSVKKLEVRTAFTVSAYEVLEERVRKSIRTRSGMNELTDKGWELFESFISKAEGEGIIHRVKWYERAWNIDSVYGDVDFKCMVQFLLDTIGHRLGIDKIGIPWEAMLKVFMRSDGTVYKVQVKTLVPKSTTRRMWRDIITRLLPE